MMSWVDPHPFESINTLLRRRVWIDSRRHWRSTLYNKSANLNFIFRYIPQSDDSESAKEIANLTYNTKGSLTVSIPIDNNCYSGKLLHQMAARRQIQDLEENSNYMSDEIKGEISDLALKHSIASKYTSFVGVDKKTRKSLEPAMSTHQIHQEVPLGYGSNDSDSCGSAMSVTNGANYSSSEDSDSSSDSGNLMKLIHLQLAEDSDSSSDSGKFFQFFQCCCCFCPMTRIFGTWLMKLSKMPKHWSTATRSNKLSPYHLNIVMYLLFY